MFCPACQAENQTSLVFPKGSTRTLLGFGAFFDEEGKEHVHDPNCEIHHYSCSRGHKFSVRNQNTCWCGWKGRAECFCHPLGARIYEEVRK